MARPSQKAFVQGDLLNIAHSEESDLTWRSAIYSLPRRVLSFAINSSIDTLPTFRNLKLWGKKMSSKLQIMWNHPNIASCTSRVQNYVRSGHIYMET